MAELLDEVEGDFILAQRLGWRSVAEMYAGMTHMEYMQWCLHFGRQAQRQELAAIKAKQLRAAQALLKKGGRR